MKSLGETFFGRQLARLADLVLRRPGWFLWPQVALALGCALYAIFFLEFDTNRDHLVGNDKKYQKVYLEYKKEFPAQDDLVVVAEGDDAEKNRQFVERLGAKLATETNIFTAVLFKGDLKMMGRKALLFASDSDLTEMQKMLHGYRPFIEQFARTTNLVSFFSMVNTQFRTAKQEANATNDSLLGALPALERIVTQTGQSLSRSGIAPSPGVSALFGGGNEADQQIYITFDEGRIFLVTAQARTAALSMDAVERIRVLMQETQREVPGINVGLTGGPVLEHDEMAQSQKDTTIATILSLVICALIFIYGYSETGRPVKATLCLLVGLAYTLGYATLVVGHLNLLTITFLPMLIGLAIDFGVHLVTRYEEELRHGHSETEALRTAMIYTGQGIFTGALTTAGAFLAVWFTDFKGIQEMGLISGGGLVICLVPMLTMLPVLLLRGRQNVLDHKLTDKPDTRGRIEQTWLSRPALVVGLTMVVCGLCVTQFHKIYFDYNLLNMQSRDLPAVNFERKLIAAATQSGTNGNGKSVLFAAVMADTAADAVAMEKKILQLPSVAEVESMSRFLAADQTQKLATIREIKMEVADIRFAAPDTNAVDVAELSRTLWALSGYLGQAADATVKDEPVLSKQLTAFKRTITQTRKIILSAKPAEAAARLAKFQEALFTDVCETFDTIREQDDAQALRPQDLPETLRARFVGVTGKYLLQVFPKQDIWQRANQQQFVGELRAALDPQHTEKPIITGEPVQLLEYTGLLKSSYELAAWYSLAAIVLLVLIHFRNLGSLLLALVPVIIGAIWLGGFMGLCGIPFNPANIMTLPLVIGIGVTNGIHILNRYAEEKTPSIFSKSTGKAVLVSGLTTIAGFGSLMVAEHQGIQSLGYVMAMGVTTCMVAGLIFLPALLNLRARGK